MFPIRDHNPSGRTPYVVYTLMALNILFFVLTLPIAGNDAALMAFYSDFAAIPILITHGQNLETLVTSMFLHGGLFHIAGNMLFLWIFGDNMEDRMGHGWFLLFYLVSGVGAALIHVLSAPLSDVPMVGASGAIAGVMGGYLLLFPKARVDILIFLIIIIRILPIPAWLMLGLWLGMQFLGGIGADPSQGGVAYWAHAGGFAVGLVLTVPLWLRLGGPRFWDLNHGHPDHPEATYRFSPSRIPRVPRRGRTRQNKGPWG
ncbi:MAG: rhomboid family intramembrane serine protease [Marinibacterium sp.]|nr:rhomboid family intramembrane serine protease [Marinibacterium sp.]